MIEDFSKSIKFSKSLYFDFPFSWLRDCGFPCFINNKMIFHQVQCENSYTAEGMPLHLSISLVNSKKSCKTAPFLCVQQTLLAGLNLADYYLCSLFSYLLVKSFWGQGEWEGVPCKRSIDEGKDSCLAFPLRSKAQEDGKTRENRPLSEELLRLQSRREWGGGGWLPLAGKWPAVRARF